MAREINFRANGEQSPLNIVDPMRFEINQIRKMATAEDTTCYCYLGLTYELGALIIMRIKEYLESLGSEDVEISKLCFIIGHVNDSDSYLEAEVINLIKLFQSRGHLLEIPAMADRLADVCIIAQSIFTTLRLAHSFLVARTLSRGAIQYL